MQSENNLKVCVKCRTEKPPLEFNKDGRLNDGLRKRCKICEFEIKQENKAQSTFRSKRVKKRKPKHNLTPHKQDNTSVERYIKRKHSEIKSSAKARNYPFHLTIPQVATFYQKPCHYCKGEVAKIGIDRVDNNKGYYLWNCVSCCIRCNRMKLNLSLTEFKAHILKLYAFFYLNFES